MRNLQLNILRFITRIVCLIPVTFLFVAVLPVNQIIYGSDSPPERSPEILLYCQNAQSELYNLQSAAGELHSFGAPPAVTTGPALNITENSAILRGTVNANGLSTTVWFQYRIVDGPSKNTFSTQTVIGTSDTEVSMNIIQLIPETIYYYRIVAKNDAGTVFGYEISFATTDYKTYATSEITQPTGGIVINNGAYYTNSETVTLTLSATDNTGVTGYYLSANGIPPYSSTAGWVTMPQTITFKEYVAYELSNGDGENTVYVWYKDIYGNISEGASAAIILDTTSPTIAITDPTSDPAYKTTHKTINISGSASDDTGVIGSVAWSNSREKAIIDGKTINWTIPNIHLREGDNDITVEATDKLGNTSRAKITITYAMENNPPEVTTGLTTNITTNMVTLNGSVNAMGLPTTAWFQYGTSSDSYTDATLVQNIEDISQNTLISSRISSLQDGTAYYYRLAAQNSVGAVYGNELTFHTALPKGTIHGYVADFISGKPIETVKLRLKGTKARKKAFKVIFSGENGFFEYKNLDADIYDVFVIKKDFKSTRTEVELKKSEKKEIEISLKKIQGEEQQRILGEDKKGTRTPSKIPLPQQRR